MTPPIEISRFEIIKYSDVPIPPSSKVFHKMLEGHNSCTLHIGDMIILAEFKRTQDHAINPETAILKDLKLACTNSGDGIIGISCRVILNDVPACDNVHVHPKTHILGLIVPNYTVAAGAVQGNAPGLILNASIPDAIKPPHEFSSKALRAAPDRVRKTPPIDDNIQTASPLNTKAGSGRQTSRSAPKSLLTNDKGAKNSKQKFTKVLRQRVNSWSPVEDRSPEIIAADEKAPLSVAPINHVVPTAAAFVVNVDPNAKYEKQLDLAGAISAVRLVKHMASDLGVLAPNMPNHDLRLSMKENLIQTIDQLAFDLSKPSHVWSENLETGRTEYIAAMEVIKARLVSQLEECKVPPTMSRVARLDLSHLPDVTHVFDHVLDSLLEKAALTAGVTRKPERVVDEGPRRSIVLDMPASETELPGKLFKRNVDTLKNSLSAMRAMQQDKRLLRNAPFVSNEVRDFKRLHTIREEVETFISDWEQASPLRKATIADVSPKAMAEILSDFKVKQTHLMYYITDVEQQREKTAASARTTANVAQPVVIQDPVIGGYIKNKIQSGPVRWLKKTDSAGTSGSPAETARSV